MRSSRYDAIAFDFDGTLASDGKVSRGTLAALRRARAAGVALLVATGRELEDLMLAFAEVVDLFDVVVAENGALLYWPKPFPREQPLASPPPVELARTLAARGVTPLSTGRIIIATREPFREIVGQTIAELELPLEVVGNKGAVMVLPAGVDKGSGVRAALAELGIAPSRAIAIGDAENDHSLLDACGLGVAVADAVPSLKKRADLVLLRGGFTVLLRRLLAAHVPAAASL